MPKTRQMSAASSAMTEPQHVDGGGFSPIEDKDGDVTIGERPPTPATTSPSSTPQLPAAHPKNEIDALLQAFTESQKIINSLLIREKPAEPSGPPTPTSTFAGNFAKCTARFAGEENNPEVVEAFLDSIEIYKECTGVSDEHALRGLPMLLSGDAAVWWRGVRGSVTTWTEATRRLRAMYGAPRPGYKIFPDLLTKQGSERAEVFISGRRALLARLPYKLPTEAEIDIIYGMLNQRIRERVVRTDVKCIEQLVSRARAVEEETIEATEVSPSLQSFSAGSNSVETKKRQRVRCTHCRKFGHDVEKCRNVVKTCDTPKVRCYGCGEPGVIRSKCTKCTPPSPKIDFQTFEPNHSLDRPSDSPLISITIFDRNGVAIVDSGASQCIASPGLYHIMQENGVNFFRTSRNIGLADGTSSVREVLEGGTTVTVEGREVFTDFIVIPDAETRTILGRNFLRTAGVGINIHRGGWFFDDDPKVLYPFYKHNMMVGSGEELLHTHTQGLTLREEEGRNLTPDERTTLNKFIISRANQFAATGPATDFATHRIKTTEKQEPIASPPYKMSQTRKDALEKEITKLLETDVIEECESPWAANVVLVPKKDGNLRLCVDYRKLNAVTEADRYPLPRIEEILHAAKTSNYMTTLDLQSGYFQVSVEEDDKDKTAFISPLGTYRFKRMPMGLRNSGATFQRLMDRFRGNLKDITIFSYLDDLVLLSGTLDKHLKDLEAVFDRLKMYNLRVNRNKSQFVRDTVKFLGHVIVPGGIQMDPDKTAAITKLPAPKNLKHLKSFIQTSSWFRRFIPNYADAARPLTNLLKKDANWQWGTEQEQAFDRIKTLLVSAPILRQADETLPFTLRTDSSGYCLGAVLMQGEGTEERPIEYASRLLNGAEKNYTTTEREALAVVWAVTKFRGYIEGNRVIVKSDHQPLRWLMTTKSPSGRLARWALTLQEYNLRIDYTPGKSNVIADTLSRPPCEQEADYDLCMAVIDLPARSAKDIRENQLKDSEVQKIINDLEDDDVPFRGRPWSNKGYIMSDGVLYRYPPDGDEEEACLVVPEHERLLILAEYHDAPTAGHFGVERTLHKIIKKFYWTGMRTFVSNYIKGCGACQRYKADNKKPAGLVQTPATSRRFEVVSVDLFGPLPETERGNKWILIIEDVCSRWVELFPLKNSTSVECARVLTEEVFLRYGVARRMVSDNGVQFVSEVMQQVCHVLGIKQTLTPYYHPEANPIERKNRDMKPQLAILVGRDHRTWDTFLPAVRFAMNSATTASTGQSPAFLTFGRELRAPADATVDMRAIVERDVSVAEITPYLRQLSTALVEARDVHEKIQNEKKTGADSDRRDAPDYKEGDFVLLKTQGCNDTDPGQTAKFIPRRDGPYKVRKAVSTTTYELESATDGTFLGKYHVSHLTPFIGTANTPVREKRRRGRPRRLADYELD